MHKQIHLWILLGIVAVIIACSRSSTEPENQITAPSLKGAFIANEGNFSQGNASISYYDAEAKTISNGVFQSANSEALGDVANSILIDDTLCYIVVNNSDKIEVISTNSFKRIKTISLPGGSSPRHIALSGDGRALVTNLYSNSVQIVDLSTGAVTNSVLVGDNPEEILIKDGKAYVTNSGFGDGNTVSVFSISGQPSVQEISVGDNPQWVRLDAEGEIHVLCGGAFGDYNNPNDDTPGGVWVINPATNVVTDSLVLAAGPHPSELAISGSGRGYFLYNGAVLEYSTTTNEVTNDSLITGLFYHINVDDASERLYALDAKDFVSNGALIIYDFNGVEQSRHTAGIIPGFVAFKSLELENLPRTR